MTVNCFGGEWIGRRRYLGKSKMATEFSENGWDINKKNDCLETKKKRKEKTCNVFYWIKKKFSAFLFVVSVFVFFERIKFCKSLVAKFDQ